MAQASIKQECSAEKCNQKSDQENPQAKLFSVLVTNPHNEAIRYAKHSIRDDEEYFIPFHGQLFCPSREIKVTFSVALKHTKQFFARIRADSSFVLGNP